MQAFLPIVASLWSGAELLTAFLLFSQFYVAGRLSFALVAAAYAFSGLLTIPYLLAFPHVLFQHQLSLGATQISPWLWIAWHVAFPLVIGIVLWFDPKLDRFIVPRERIRAVLGSILLLVASLTTGIATIAIAGRDHLPVIITLHGSFTATYQHYLTPAIFAVNCAAYVVAVRSLVSGRSLQMWIGVALLSAALDGLLNAFSPGRYTLTWYLGKLEALTTASAVLAMLLLEIATLYRRLFDAASADALTGLPNRRVLESTLGTMFGEQRIETSCAALIVLDLDHFKAFNDEHGHAAGDRALRTVAAVLRNSVHRAGDIVARYGGEEFAIVLHSTTEAGARLVAERVRNAVASTPIVLPDAAVVHASASFGVALVTGDVRDTEALFARADRALYAAKARGRNCVVMDGDPEMVPVVLTA